MTNEEMRALAETVVLARLGRLHWVNGLGEPLIEGHMPAEVLGEKTPAEREWFAMARKVIVPSHDHVTFPRSKFRHG